MQKISRKNSGGFNLRAHQWITKEYERLRNKDVEFAYEIYDYKPNKTRIFVNDEWFLLSEQSPS